MKKKFMVIQNPHSGVYWYWDGISCEDCYVTMNAYIKGNKSFEFNLFKTMWKIGDIIINGSDFHVSITDIQTGRMALNVMKKIV